MLTALTSWRWAYGAGAAGVLAAGTILFIRVGPDPARQHVAVTAPTTRLAPGGWLAILGMFGLMGAAQSLFVTFGPWLEDVFGFGTIGLAAVTFGIGGLELAASTTSAARTDRWGKERSVVRGTMLMIPCGLLLAAFDERLAIGLDRPRRVHRRLRVRHRLDDPDRRRAGAGITRPRRRHDGRLGDGRAGRGRHPGDAAVRELRLGARCPDGRRVRHHHVRRHGVAAASPTPGSRW